MKKIIFVLSIFLSGIIAAKSQDLPYWKEVHYIDSVLSKNPYFENFLGITYYYSIDITPEKEMIVKMDFKGPFTSIFKARINELKNAFEVDTTEYTSSICWHCLEDGSGKEKRCIFQENIYTSGERDTVNSDDICIQLPTQSDLRNNLIKSLEKLLIKAGR